MFLNIDKEKSYLPSKYTKYRKKKAQNRNQSPICLKPDDGSSNQFFIKQERFETINVNSGKSSHCSTPYKRNALENINDSRYSDIENNLASSFTCLKCNNSSNEKRRLIKVLKSVNDNLEKNELKEIISLYREELRAQWTQLAQVIDAFLIYMFTLSTFLLIGYLVNRVPRERFLF